MSYDYKMHWLSAKALAFDPDRMKIAFRLTKDGATREGVGEVMLSRHPRRGIALEIIHTTSVSDQELRTTKYSLTPALVSKIKKAKSDSGEDLLWLEA